MIQILIILVILHMIADYPLQGNFLAEMKGKYNYLLFCHSFIWSGLISFGLIYLGLFSVWKFLFLLLGHFFIDMYKCRKEDKTNALTKDLWIDQVLHLVQLIVVII